MKKFGFKGESSTYVFVAAVAIFSAILGFSFGATWRGSLFESAPFGWAEFWLNRYQTLIGLMGTVGAIAVAWKTLKATLGDVPATTGVFQEANEEFSSLANASVEIVNNNRKPMLITMISLRFPDNVEVLKGQDDMREMIKDIIKRVNSRDFDYKFAVPLRIRGSFPGHKPEMFVMPLQCRWQNDAERSPFELIVECNYRFEGESNNRQLTASARIFAPDDSL